MTLVAFPESAEDLRALVATMRDLGVASAFGVILGPAPSRLEELRTRERTTPGDAVLSEEIAAEIRRERIESARQEVRDKLAATGREYTDGQIDAFLDPRVLE